jgi:hypothetical protein
MGVAVYGTEAGAAGSRSALTIAANPGIDHLAGHHVEEVFCFFFSKKTCLLNFGEPNSWPTGPTQ